MSSLIIQYENGPYKIKLIIRIITTLTHSTFCIGFVCKNNKTNRPDL